MRSLLDPERVIDLTEPALNCNTVMPGRDLHTALTVKGDVMNTTIEIVKRELSFTGPDP
jgi:hypothetical protein